MAATSISAVDRPLKDRFWLYRNRVLHQRRNAAGLDDLYWQYRSVAITALNPSTGPKQTDVTIAIIGTGFDAAPRVSIGSAYGLVPTSISTTALTVLVHAANIQQAGIMPMSVTNSDGQLSNAINFTVV